MDRKRLAFGVGVAVLVVLLVLVPGCAERGSGWWPSGDPWPNDYRLPGSSSCLDGCEA